MDQFGDGLYLHLPHQAAAVHFYRFLCRAQFAGDLLVQHPGDDQVEDFSLAVRQS